MIESPPKWRIKVCKWEIESFRISLLLLFGFDSAFVEFSGVNVYLDHGNENQFAVASPTNKRIWCETHSDESKSTTINTVDSFRQRPNEEIRSSCRALATFYAYVNGPWRIRCVNLAKNGTQLSVFVFFISISFSQLPEVAEKTTKNKTTIKTITLACVLISLAVYFLWILLFAIHLFA